ncbi:MAG TPA: glycosyltransferase family 39 protein [Polyangia bacterium]|nr:glycosyltransferase family 39 protein [Polyangia bacterium]
MNETARTPSVPATYALLAALALALFVPRLGSYGFWDPYEIRIADAARAHANGAPIAQAAMQLGRPAVSVALAAAGFRAFGTGELGGRLPIALVALLAVLACFYAGSGLIRRRGALLGSFILATTPAFLLGARQLTTNAPLLLATALAVGGLARALWPPEGSSAARPFFDALIACVGLVLGQLAAGMLVGIVAPLAGVALALVLGAPSRRLGGYALAAVALALFVWTGVAWSHPAGYSALLGGTPHPFLSTVVFTNPLKQLGFGLFPWIALLPMAGIHALQSTTSDGPLVAAEGRGVAAGSGGEPGERQQFGQLVLVAWFVALYIAATLQAAGAQELLLPAAPAALLLIGAWLDDLLDSPDAQPFAALTAALGVIIVGRDFYVFPEQFVGVHMLETIRWPGPLTAIPYVIVGFACFFAGVIAVALGVPLARASAPVEAKLRGRFILVGGAIAASLVMALGTAHYVVPHVSKHLSSRDLYGKTKALDPNAPLGQYRFNATGSAYYSGGKAPTNLPSLDDLFRFLGKSERVFVMAGVDELPSIDQHAKQKSLGYYVVDDSSSRYLTLSNRLGPKEHDLNPLKLYVSDKAPTPAHPAAIDFDHKVELIGWDAPPVVEKGQDIKLRLYFKVLAPIAGSYKVFVHIDGAGTRINGDHAPLEGRFATNYWVPGFFITDEHNIRPDRGTENSGFYNIFIGLYQGAERMKVLAGPSDGDNRAKLGTLTVR